MSACVCQQPEMMHDDRLGANSGIILYVSELLPASLLIKAHWRGKKGHIMETYGQISHSIHMGQATQQSDGRCNLGWSGLDHTGCSYSHRLMLETKYRKILPNFMNIWTSGSTLPYRKVTAPKTSAVYFFFAIIPSKHRPAAHARFTCRRSVFPSAGAGRLLFCESLQHSWVLFHLDN